MGRQPTKAREKFWVFGRRPGNGDSCGRCCGMVVSVVEGKGKPVVKFVLEDCVRQEMSADANVATFTVDWRVHNKDHVTEAIMLDLKGQHKWLARDRDNMMVHTGRASCGRGVSCVDCAQEAREKNQ